MNSHSLNSVITSINPLVKIAMFISFTINLFVINSVVVLVGIFVLLIAIMIFANIQLGIFKWLLGSFAAGLPLLALLFVLSGYEMFQNWSEAFEWGMLNLLVFTLKIKSLVLMNIIIVKTTSIKDFTTSFRSIGLPEKATLFMTTVIRFIPLSFEEGKRVIEIQKCRGFHMKQLFNPKNFLPVFIPLFISHLKKAGDLALILEIRYFSLHKSSHKGVKLNLAAIDYLLIVFTICYLISGFSFTP